MKIRRTVIFAICFCLNGYLIHQLWNKWMSSSVIVSFGETAIPVWNVPFPAVTICSEVKSKSFDFKHHFTNMYHDGNDTDEETKRKIADITLLCDDHVQVDGPTYANRSDIEFLLEVSPPLDETIWKCKWKDIQANNCSSLFTRILTKEGFCYTFNMLDKVDIFRKDSFPYFNPHGNRRVGWSLDDGYDKDAPLSAYPNRAFSAGARAGLSIYMRAEEEVADYYCRGPVRGFKMSLHNPADIPMIDEHYLRIPLNREMVVVLEPNIMTTSKSLLSYDAHIRQCYYSSERYLSHFKIYTPTNCKLECLTNFTLGKCGCVGHHMPRTGETRICGAGKKMCMIEAEDELRMKEITSSYKGLSSECDCLPACTSIQYRYENNHADFETPISSRDNKDGTKRFKESRISIFFKEIHFKTSQRSELLSIADFIAKCGGILGLCCGFGLFNFFELIHYITLRIYGKTKTLKKNKEEKLISEETSEACEMKYM